MRFIISKVKLSHKRNLLQEISLCTSSWSPADEKQYEIYNWGVITIERARVAEFDC